jgi:hypothetical protein
MAGRGPWVMVSPDGVRYYIRDIDAANELADYNSDMKMTRPNLLAYLGANEHSTATKRPPQHIKQWQLQDRAMAVRRDDTGQSYLVIGDAKHFLEHHRQPGMEALDGSKLQSLLNGNYQSGGKKTDTYRPGRKSKVGWQRVMPANVEKELLDALPWVARPSKWACPDVRWNGTCNIHCVVHLRAGAARSGSRRCIHVCARLCAGGAAECAAWRLGCVDRADAGTVRWAAREATHLIAT